VYRFDSDLPTLIKTKGTISESLVGISKASTFTGFSEAAFLLTFRAVAREIHDKILNTGIYDRRIACGRAPD